MEVPLRPAHISASRAAARWKMTIHAGLVFGPLTLLTVIGIWGLVASHRAARETARTETARRLEVIAAQLELRFDELRHQARTPRMYPLVPEPAEPNEMQKRYARAISLPARDAQPLLAEIEADNAKASTESGIPLLPLVKWAELRQCDISSMRDSANALGKVAVELQPSILSPELLDRAEELLRENAIGLEEMEEWRTHWEQDEEVRNFLRKHPELLGTNAPAAWLNDDGRHWYVVGDTAQPGAIAVFRKEDLGDLAKTIVGNARGETPAYAAIRVSFHDEPLIDALSSAETLALIDRSGFRTEAVLAHPKILYQQQWKQIAWLAALLGSAVLTTVAGYYAMQRSLARERQLHLMKSNFVASVSHELRAPVASMRVMAENLGNGIVTEQTRQKQYHQLIAEECARLSTLIENVLDLSRIEQDRKLYRFAEMDVASMVNDAVALISPIAARRGQRISVNIASIDPPPHCDALAIQRVLINLLDNASKFSPVDSAITVCSAMAEGDHWILSVADEGPGIAVQEREKIFERFYRIGSELRREAQGAGIGLSIVRHIAESHGGVISLEDGQAGGSLFILRLPLVSPSDLPSERDV